MFTELWLSEYHPDFPGFFDPFPHLFSSPCPPPSCVSKELWLCSWTSPELHESLGGTSAVEIPRVHSPHISTYFDLLHRLRSILGCPCGSDSTEASTRRSTSPSWGRASSSRATATRDMPRRPSWHRCFAKWAKSQRCHCRRLMIQWLIPSSKSPIIIPKWTDPIRNQGFNNIGRPVDIKKLEIYIYLPLFTINIH